MTDIAVIVVGYVFVVRWLVRRLEANREKLLPNLPEWLRCVLLIVVCAVPFVGSVWFVPLAIPAIGVLSALVNAVIDDTEVFVMMQALIGLFAWLSSRVGLALHRLVSDDPLSKAISELFLFIELTILVIATVILAIRKHRKNKTPSR